MLDISAKRGATRTRMRVEVVSVNGIPQIDTAALTAFTASLFSDQLGGRGDDVTSA